MFDALELNNYERPWTPAEPLPPGVDDAGDPGIDSFNTAVSLAERKQRLVDNAFAAEQAREEAYQRRIAAVKAATGIQLENPERGGYSLSERDLRRLTQENGGPIDPMAHRRNVFEEKLAEIRAANPDQAEALMFPDVTEEAKSIAKQAEIEGERPNDLTAIGNIAASVIGGAWGSRRDPLFVGSLFAGPTSAIGKTVTARIASSALFQGLYNAGIAVAEQPDVQAWRQEIGVRSGLQPAMENVGMALLFGAIPGAAFRGLHEAMAAKPSIERVLRGAPEPGDVDTALRTVGSDLQPNEAAAVRMGEQMIEADKAVLPPAARGVPDDLHNDMTAAALRAADDPINSPAPEAVAALRSEPDPALAARIAEAEPRTEREALMAATEALEETGTKSTNARLTGDLGRPALEPPPVRTPEEIAAAKLPAKDPLEKVPFVRDDGTPALLSKKAAAELGQREAEFAMLVRSCK